VGSNLLKSRVFYTSDCHGSEVVFRKFLNAGKVYKANAIIMGGDITGKLIIPIIQNPDGTFKCHFMGSDVTVAAGKECEDQEATIRYAGFYPYRTTLDEMKVLTEDQSRLDALFTELMMKSLESWIGLAEDTLRGTGVRCFILPGNDDRFDIDAVLDKSDVVVQPEGKVLDLDGYHCMISTGYTNVTPWKAPRDVSEEELELRINKMTSQVDDFKRCVFNFHCPPYNSGLDEAPKLDETFKPIIQSGQYVMAPAGSKAVRAAIEKYQPKLGLHGHIHESRGNVRIGSTSCFNPGSEYAQGFLKGVIVNLDEKKILSHLMISG
jgi:Icc-related predicted phosphoesterase